MLYRLSAKGLTPSVCSRCRTRIHVRAFKTSAVSLRTDKRIRFPRTDLNENVSVEDIKQFRRVEKKFGTVTGELEESKAFDEIPRYFPKGVPTGEDDVPDWFGEPQQERPYDPLDFDRDEDFAKGLVYVTQNQTFARPKVHRFEDDDDDEGDEDDEDKPEKPEKADQKMRSTASNVGVADSVFASMQRSDEKDEEEDEDDEEEEEDLEASEPTAYPNEWLVEEVLRVGRHAQVTAAGRVYSFSALVLLGTGKGTAGLGYARGNSGVEAVQLAKKDAQKNIISLDLYRGNNIGADIKGRFKKSWCWMKGLSPGSGITASYEMKKFLTAFGITDITIGVGGSRNRHNRYRALFQAIRDGHRTPQRVARILGRKLVDRNRAYYYKWE